MMGSININKKMGKCLKNYIYVVLPATFFLNASNYFLCEFWKVQAGFGFVEVWRSQNGRNLSRHGRKVVQQISEQSTQKLIKGIYWHIKNFWGGFIDTSTTFLSTNMRTLSTDSSNKRGRAVLFKMRISSAFENRFRRAQTNFWRGFIDIRQLFTTPHQTFPHENTIGPFFKKLRKQYCVV